MNNRADLFDRDKEPADRFHPDFESFTAWLDAEAPAHQAQKLRNRRYQPQRVIKPAARTVKS